MLLHSRGSQSIAGLEEISAIDIRKCLHTAQSALHITYIVYAYI